MLLQKKDLARWGVFHQVLGGGSMRSGGPPITFENCRNQILGCYICMSFANYF